MIDISKFIKKNTGSGALPSKKSLNLYVRETDGNSAQVVLPLAIFLAVIIFAVYRLGVVDRLSYLAELQAENSALKSQLESVNEKASEYDEVLEEYRRFTTSYLSEEEKGIVSRERIFNMIDECTEGVGSIKSISIELNQVALIVDIASLEDIDTIQDRLNSMSNINEIMLSTAKGTNNIEVQGNIIFTVKEEENEADEALTSKGALTQAERAARYEEYTAALKEAREAEESGKSSTQSIQKAESIYGGSVASVSSGSGEKGAQEGSTAKNTIEASAGTVAQSTEGGNVSVQTIGGDTVVIGSDPSKLPQGYASLEEGMAALQGAGS